MPGMMRSRATGCTCCGDWVADRAVEKREWQRIERGQTAPWELLPGQRREPYAGILETLWLTYGYWAVERGDY